PTRDRRSRRTPDHRGGESRRKPIRRETVHHRITQGENRGRTQETIRPLKEFRRKPHGSITRIQKIPRFHHRVGRPLSRGHARNPAQGILPRSSLQSRKNGGSVDFPRTSRPHFRPGARRREPERSRAGRSNATPGTAHLLRDFESNELRSEKLPAKRVYRRLPHSDRYGYVHAPASRRSRQGFERRLSVVSTGPH